MKPRTKTVDAIARLAVILTACAKPPVGGVGTNLDNSKLPPGKWFKGKTHQENLQRYVFFADRGYLLDKKSKSVLLKDLVLQYDDGTRQNVSPVAALHEIIYG